MARKGQKFKQWTAEEKYKIIKPILKFEKSSALVTKEKMGSVSNYVVCKTSDITYLITDADE